jgi:hypothetical protein
VYEKPSRNSKAIKIDTKYRSTLHEDPSGQIVAGDIDLSNPTGYVMHQQFNLLKPTGYVMNQQV